MCLRITDAAFEVGVSGDVHGGHPGEPPSSIINKTASLIQPSVDISLNYIQQTSF